MDRQHSVRECGEGCLRPRRRHCRDRQHEGRSHQHATGRSAPPRADRNHRQRVPGEEADLQGCHPSDIALRRSNDDNRPVLIAYDGSDFAKGAIAQAADQLEPGRRAVVLTVWEPLEEMPFLGIRGVAADSEAVETVIAETKAGAERVAREGAELASAAGFDAGAEIAGGYPAWRQIVDVAEEQDASLIVLGSRGRSGLNYVLLGSVATAVAQHSTRSVLIVHSRP